MTEHVTAGDLDALLALHRASVPGVSSLIAEEERMGRSNPAHYFSVGQSALRLVKLGLLASGKQPQSVRRILDLPCGHGRVLRTLAAAFPHATLTACDLLADGVDFCAAHFGAVPVYSRPLPEPGLFPDAGAYDLIFVGSLMTHLDAHLWPVFCGLFEQLLAPDGLLVLTTHGPFVAERMRRGETYGFEDRHAPEGTLPWSESDGEALAGACNRGMLHLLREYERTGFGYLDDGSGVYGITVSSPVWTLAQFAPLPSLRVVSYLERGWDEHQDVVVLLKRPLIGPGGA